MILSDRQFLIVIKKREVDIPKWVARHDQDVTRPILDKVINELKEQGVKKFAATGYCFGGGLENLRTARKVIDEDAVLTRSIRL